MKQEGKHLLIDGYNVIHSLPSLKKLLEESQEAACESLIRMARAIHDEEGIRVTVVFDGREKTVQIERPCQRVTFSVVYASSQLSADGVIEQLLARSRQPEQITVASRDNMIREASAARGAFFIDGSGFEDWVTRCEKRITSRSSGKKSKTWENSLGDLWEDLE
ncbi:MAG: NYN domain-containing protein [Verrucomicrobiota bacterium]